MGALAKAAFPEASDDALDPIEVVHWTGDDCYDSRIAPDGFKFGWTQATCERCWVERQGFRQPTRVRDEFHTGAEPCAFCGRPTWVGIYTRADPAKVPYPRIEEA